MKYAIVFLTALAISLMASCTQHMCPTYANSGIKYHSHPTHVQHHH